MDYMIRTRMAPTRQDCVELGRVLRRRYNLFVPMTGDHDFEDEYVEIGGSACACSCIGMFSKIQFLIMDRTLFFPLQCVQILSPLVTSKRQGQTAFLL